MDEDRLVTLDRTQQGKVRGTAETANHGVDLVLTAELRRHGRGGVGLALGVLDDQVELAAENAAGITNQLQLPLLMFQLNKRLTVTNITTSLMEHRAIATSMLEGDVAGAEAKMRSHLDRARSVACEMPSQVFRTDF